MHSTNRQLVLRIFMLLILGLTLPVWITPLEARAPAAGPDIPRVTFGGTLRGQIHPASFSVVQT